MRGSTRHLPRLMTESLGSATDTAQPSQRAHWWRRGAGLARQARCVLVTCGFGEGVPLLQTTACKCASDGKAGRCRPQNRWANHEPTKRSQSCSSPRPTACTRRSCSIVLIVCRWSVTSMEAPLMCIIPPKHNMVAWRCVGCCSIRFYRGPQSRRRLVRSGSHRGNGPAA